MASHPGESHTPHVDRLVLAVDPFGEFGELKGLLGEGEVMGSVGEAPVSGSAVVDVGHLRSMSLPLIAASTMARVWSGRPRLALVAAW